MKLNEKIIPVATTDTQRQLFALINETIKSFWQRMTAVQLDGNHLNLYYDIIRDFETAYKSINPQFRAIFCAENSAKTNVNLYSRSFNNHKMIDMLRSRHPEYITQIVNGFTKFQFNVVILAELFREQLRMMIAQYGTKFHYLQFLISFTKCVIEYFNATEVDWAAAMSLADEFYKNVSYEEIAEGAGFYGVSVRTRKSGLKYQTKTSDMELKVLELINQGKNKKDIAKEMNIGRTTLYRIINKHNIIFN